jgi:hypothetical protein
MRTDIKQYEVYEDGYKASIACPYFRMMSGDSELAASVWLEL